VEAFDVDEAERAAAAGCDRVAVAGGDGSIAPAAAAAGAAGIPLAVIPAGTANDFARRMGLPVDLARACRLAVCGARLRDMELGWMDERPFVNVASAGLPAPAAQRAKAWKKPLGPLGYAAGALAAGATASAVWVEVACDGGTFFEGDAWQVTVAASGAFGAGARIAEADPHDGALEVVAVAAGGPASSRWPTACGPAGWRGTAGRAGGAVRARWCGCQAAPSGTWTERSSRPERPASTGRRTRSG
jgi:diacylglycerol kinase (ATP)